MGAKPGDSVQPQQRLDWEGNAQGALANASTEKNRANNSSLQNRSGGGGGGGVWGGGGGGGLGGEKKKKKKKSGALKREQRKQMNLLPYSKKTETVREK